MLLVIDIPAFQHRRLIVQQRAVRAAVVLSILPIYRLADGRPAAVSRRPFFPAVYGNRRDDDDQDRNGTQDKNGLGFLGKAAAAGFIGSIKRRL